jgi:DNA topoisomerase-2
VRLDYYNKRKAHKLDKYEKELLFLDSRIKFILSVIDGNLKIMDCKQSDIKDYLDKNKFPKVDEKYDYLIRMPIYNFTFEKKEELLKEYNEKNTQYEMYKALTIESMWLQDLDELENHLKNDK